MLEMAIPENMPLWKHKTLIIENGLILIVTWWEKLHMYFWPLKVDKENLQNKVYTYTALSMFKGQK